MSKRAKVIIAANTTVESFEPTAKADRMICIAERRTEFLDALVRGKNSDLEVYSDWASGIFISFVFI